MALSKSKAAKRCVHIKNPIREVLHVMTGSYPPDFVVGHDYSGLTDAEHSKLHSWAVRHCKPRYLTGIGLIEAAEAMVDEAVANGNLPPAPFKLRVPSVIRQIHRQRRRLVTLLGKLSVATADEEKELNAWVEEDVSACRTRLKTARGSRSRKKAG